MSPDRALKYLWDAHRAAERIARFTAGSGHDEYLANDMMRAAVERQFEIIGEAFASLRRVDPGLAAGIPDLSRVVAFRNLLIHAYATVDDRLVWAVVERDLPRLRAALAGLLDRASGGQPES